MAAFLMSSQRALGLGLQRVREPKQQPHARGPPVALRAAAGASAGQPADQPSSSGSTDDKPKTLLGKIKHFFVGSKLEKEKLAALGMGAFASYGVISNITYGVCLTIAWAGFVKATGTSPLDPGQWKPFLAFYAGLWTIQNFVRPMRFALAVALAPAFERVIGWIGEKARAPKPVAFGILMVVIAVCTTAGLGSAISILAPGSLAPLLNHLAGKPPAAPA